MRRSRSGGRRRCRRGAPANRRRRRSARSIAAAIERVRDEARPDPRDADELHDALLTVGFLTGDGLRRPIAGRAVRSARASAASARALRAAHPESHLGRGRAAARDCAPSIRRRCSIRAIAPPPSRAARAGRASDALVELSAGASRIARPDDRAGSPSRSASPRPTPTRRCSRSKREGVVLRGTFHAGAGACDSNGAIAACSRASTATR